MGAYLKPVYLDRDGVINLNRADYIRSLEEWIPIPGAIEAIVRLSNAGHPVIVLTNQSAITRNYCSVSDVEGIHKHLLHLVCKAGGLISGIYYCPHHPDDGCECRKPRTGMIESARLLITILVQMQFGTHLLEIMKKKQVSTWNGSVMNMTMETVFAHL